MILENRITFVSVPLLMLSCISCSILTPRSEQKDKPTESLWSICTELRKRDFVDLTHAFGSNIPHWKGYEPMKVRNVYEINEHGFWAQEFTHVGQWGTHCDPPAHFHKGLRTIDQIEPKEMFLPLVVINVHEKKAKNPDYVLTLEDIHKWESRHGQIPAGAYQSGNQGIDPNT